MTTTAIKITSPPPKNTSGLSFSELGLYTYMTKNVDSNGLFQQHLDIMATAGRSTAPTVYRWQKALIDKGMVLVVKKSYRTRTGGYQVPPVLRPVTLFHEHPIMSRVEQVNVIQTKRVDPVSSPANPVPNGMLEPSTVSRAIKECSVENIATAMGTVVAVKQVPVPNASTQTTAPALKYQPGQKNIPSSQFDRKKLPMCIQCGLETVDFFEYQGSIDLEHFCDEESCGALWQQARQDEGEAQESNFTESGGDND